MAASPHYIHQPGVGPAPMPLLLSHGWPGSIYEFVHVIGPLTDPARYGGDPRDAFTVVARGFHTSPTSGGSVSKRSPHCFNA